MDVTKTTLTTLPLAQLVGNEGQIEGVPKNPRTIDKKKFAALVKRLRDNNLTGVQPLKVYEIEGGKFVVLGGNQRLKALRELNVESVPCIIVPQGTDANTLREIVVIDNTNDGENDWDLLTAEWDADELAEWGVDVSKFDKEVTEYSSKIEAPVYEKTTETPPPLSECVDTSKYDKLISAIDASKVDEDTKTFLRYAACRHIVFDYQQIAEVYAHAPKDVQRLFEESALVIVDFKSAIENGFVKLTEKMTSLLPEQWQHPKTL